MEREKLKSRLGFILISAGCAIGIGNVWKFAYMAGQGGGGFFVLLYLLFLVMLGIPIMSMEFAVGRASQKSPAQAYKALEKAGQKWHIHGYIALIGNYLLMMFYTTVAGWMLYYFYLTSTGKGLPSLVISVFRYVVIIIPVAFILSRIYEVNGVWWSFGVTELVTAFISYIIYKKATHHH